MKSIHRFWALPEMPFPRPSGELRAWVSLDGQYQAIRERYDVGDWVQWVVSYVGGDGCPEVLYQTETIPVGSAVKEYVYLKTAKYVCQVHARRRRKPRDPDDPRVDECRTSTEWDRIKRAVNRCQLRRHAQEHPIDQSGHRVAPREVSERDRDDAESEDWFLRHPHCDPDEEIRRRSEL